jgi:phosphotransferase system HPr-like phosphotransfer protein
VTLRVDGADEEIALRTVCDLIKAGFGELED